MNDPRNATSEKKEVQTKEFSEFVETMRKSGYNLKKIVLLLDWDQCMVDGHMWSYCSGLFQSLEYTSTLKEFMIYYWNLLDEDDLRDWFSESRQKWLCTLTELFDVHIVTNNYKEVPLTVLKRAKFDLQKIKIHGREQMSSDKERFGLTKGDFVARFIIPQYDSKTKFFFFDDDGGNIQGMRASAGKYVIATQVDTYNLEATVEKTLIQQLGGKTYKE